MMKETKKRIKRGFWIEKQSKTLAVRREEKRRQEEQKKKENGKGKQ